MRERQFNFSDCELRYIEEALLIGLTDRGTVLEARNRLKILDACHEAVDMRVPHPTGTVDVVSKYATALTIVSIARRHQSEQVAE